MNADYNSDTGMFTMEMSRGETIDLMVLLGLRETRRVIDAGMYQLGDLYGRLRWLLDANPPNHECEHCFYRIVYAEGQWRHLHDAKNRCVGATTTAWPKGPQG